MPRDLGRSARWDVERASRQPTKTVHAPEPDEPESGIDYCAYRARDTELDRTVAIKVLHAGSLAGPVEVERFLREARSAAQLKHPGIVLLYGAGWTETGVCYLVQEFIQSGTLAERLKSARLDFRRAAELTEAIAETLDYAHRQGIIHRDLKPSNIVLDQDGRPHLMDFGLAKRDAEDPPATPHGLVLGTPAYMSPEQAGGDSRLVDARSDIYSLGVVLYELLTDRRPFEGSQDQQILQVLQDSPRAPRRHDARIPRDVETIWLKAMLIFHSFLRGCLDPWSTPSRIRLRRFPGVTMGFLFLGHGPSRLPVVARGPFRAIEEREAEIVPHLFTVP